MNKRSAILAGTWALSCGAAFVIGRTTVDATDSNAATISENSLSTRTVEGRRVLSSFSDGSSSAPGTRFNFLDGQDGGEAELREAVLALTRMTDPIERAEGFLQLVKDLSPEQFLTVVDTYRGEGIGEEDFGEYRILLTAWAKMAPLDALTYAKEKTGSPFARQTILATWAKTDANGAITWARENFDNKGDENRANPWLVGVIEGLASDNLGQATTLLEELPYSRERGEALGAIFDEISQLGDQAGKDWIAGLTDPQLQAGAAARLAGMMAESDPAQAAEWVATLGTEAMTRSARTIAERWLRKDFEAAKGWVDSQPDDVVAAAGPAMVEGILRNQDPAAASAWLAPHDGNPAFDDSIRTLVWRSMDKTPELSADWIMRLSNEGDQTRTFHRVFGGWLNNDAAAAAEYVQNNPVPDGILGRVQKELAKKQK